MKKGLIAIFLIVAIAAAIAVFYIRWKKKNNEW